MKALIFKQVDPSNNWVIPHENLTVMHLIMTSVESEHTYRSDPESHTYMDLDKPNCNHCEPSLPWEVFHYDGYTHVNFQGKTLHTGEVRIILADLSEIEIVRNLSTKFSA